MTGQGRSQTTRAAALLSGTAMLAALAALPAGPAWASPADASPAGAERAVASAGPATQAPGRRGMAGHAPARSVRPPHRGTADEEGTGPPGRAGQAVARPGTNLLLNPGAQTGAVSRNGWDSITIPGWQVASGLPTAVRYGTQRFPPAT